MTITEILPILTSCKYADDALLMSGVHGIGKSQIVEQWAKENNIHCEVLLLSNMVDVGDLIGRPRDIEKDGEVVMVYSKPDWLQRMEYASKVEGKQCLIFADEMNRGSLDIRQAFLQIALERKIHQHKLPTTNGERTMVIAAINPPDGYQVAELDPALMSRFMWCNVEPDLKAFIEYGRKTEVEPVILDFLLEHPDRLHYTPEENDESETIGSNPRSWDKLSKHLKHFNRIPEESHFSIIKGKVGTEVAVQFQQFMRNYSKVVKVPDVEKVALKAWKTTQDIEQTAEFVKELCQNMEPPQLTDMFGVLLDKYYEKDSYKDAIPLVAFSYILEAETFTGFYKTLANSKDAIDKEKTEKLVQFHDELNGKELFRKFAQKRGTGN